MTPSFPKIRSPSLLGLLTNIISDNIYKLCCNNEIVELLKDHGQLGSLIISRIVSIGKSFINDCEALFNVTMEAGEFPHMGFFPL